MFVIIEETGLVHSFEKPQEASTSFKCKYHDWEYSINGSFMDIPDLETFPQEPLHAGVSQNSHVTVGGHLFGLV